MTNAVHWKIQALQQGTTGGVYALLKTNSHPPPQDFINKQYNLYCFQNVSQKETKLLCWELVDECITWRESGHLPISVSILQFLMKQTLSAVGSWSAVAVTISCVGLLVPNGQCAEVKIKHIALRAFCEGILRSDDILYFIATEYFNAQLRPDESIQYLISKYNLLTNKIFYSIHEKLLTTFETLYVWW